MATVCRPLEQKRLIVAPGTSTGKPALRSESRAMFSPCEASGMAQPQSTSSSLAGSRPTRPTVSFITKALSSTGWTLASAPFFLPFATGVRAALTITASRIVVSSFSYAAACPS